MNAGKSTALLQVAHNYEEQTRKVVVYTSHVDDRYGVGRVTSRLGIQRDALIFDNQSDFEVILAEHSELSCILIDESQFLTADQVKQLHRFAHLAGIPVICFGLRSDFQGNPFPGAAALLSLADDLEELKTICFCGKKATMNMRTDSEGNRITVGDPIQIGGNNTYKQVCARCFYLTKP